MKRIATLLAVVVLAIPSFVSAQDFSSEQESMIDELDKQEAKETFGKGSKKRRTFDPVKRGFQQSVSVGMDFDFGKTGNSSELYSVGLQYIAGYRAGNTVFIGAGTGVDVILWDDARSNNKYRYWSGKEKRFCPTPSDAMIPLFVHAKAYLSKTKCQPFFSLSAGAKFGFPTNHAYLAVWQGETIIHKERFSPTNLFAEPAFGLNFRASNRTSLYLQFGGLMQVRPYYYDVSGIKGVITRAASGGITFKFGVTF